ncbi:fungal-specific transcription factor domain-containing protein [Mycena epipterygia]|nr:fungal-specific transcription factor domain-containing protein [Mycena epipterygia]
MEPFPTTGLLYFPTTDGDEESVIPAPGSKRRRLRGACDTCRQRKIRCDSAKMPGNVCSNCIAFNSQCTHQSYAKPDNNKRSPQSAGSNSAAPSPPSASESARPDSDGYNGKTAQEHVDTILVKSTAYIAARDLRNILLDVARYSRRLEQEVEKYKAQAQAQALLRSSSLGMESAPLLSGTPSSSTDDDTVDSGPEGIYIICDEFESLTLTSARNRYFGRSSGPYLIQTARAMKEDHDGPDVRQPTPTQRQEFWTSPWEKGPAILVPVFQFPPRDLLDSLVSTFFRRVNIVMCFLHRPTFERSIVSGLHLVDYKFGAVVLGVCALASRYSDDPRVILEGTNSRLSSGWEWFRQVRNLRADLHSAPTLYDLQLIFLSIVYLQGTCSPDPCWVMTAIGVRHVQEIGVHMRKGTPSTIEEELYRRVFWMLVCSDALISSFLGRPRVTRDDDYDIDYPVACDDEYWENPDPQKRFQQPEGKPSVYAFIVVYLKLIEILGMTQKTIYSVKRSQRSSAWSQSVVAELDSALNQWLDSLPDHLRWDPNREDETFATQSACLFASYYHVQIQIHRSFIPSPGNDAPLSTTFPSLAICANSARSCSHVMEAQAKRGLVAHPHVVSALMDSAIVLLLNVWGARRTGLSADPQRAANDVQKCISVLKMYERRLQVAGRYCDLLFTIGNQLIDAPQVPRTTLKRTRSKEAARSSTPPALQEPRTIAGSRRVSAAVEQQEQVVPDLSHLYALPISTEELGHLPVYESFDWGIPFGSHFANAEAGLSFNFGVPQYNADLGFPSTIGADGTGQYTQFAEHNGGDWATRDWTTYIDGVDQLMHALDSGGRR